MKSAGLLAMIAVAAMLVWAPTLVIALYAAALALRRRPPAAGQRPAGSHIDGPPSAGAERLGSSVGRAAD